MEYQIAVLAGDGIGPEVVAEAEKVLDVVGRRAGHTFHRHAGLVGGAAIDAEGTALADATLAMCLQSDAVLFGAVGGPRWDDPAAPMRPEDGLLAVRKGLGLYANLRPVRPVAALASASPLQPARLEGVDLIVVRELTGGLYYGRPKRRWRTSRGRRAVDTMAYGEREVRRILEVGFNLASSRRGKLCSVDKANVLETSRMWREIASEMAAQAPEVQVEHMLVDTAAMQLVTNPARFDVIVTENTFGDILTDEAAVLSGSMGLLPSASLGAPRRGRSTLGLYEPIHGSAPDIAGKDLANPIAAILSLALLLRLSLGLSSEPAAVEDAVQAVLAEGFRTPDIAGADKTRVVGTREMGDLIAQRVA